MRNATNTAEVIALTFTTWWALRVLVPDQSFAAVPQAYHNMARLAPEWAWGLGVLAICLVHFIGFVFDHMTIRRAAILRDGLFLGVSCDRLPDRCAARDRVGKQCHHGWRGGLGVRHYL